MKTTILGIFLSLIGTFAFAQKKEKDTAKVHLPLKDGMVYYEKILEGMSGAKQEDLYTASLKWMAETFNDSKEVIQVKDKESGTITGSGVFKYFVQGFIGESGTISFMVDITTRDTKSRFRLYQFTNNYSPSYTSSVTKVPIEKAYLTYLTEKRFPRENKKRYQAIAASIDEIIASYEKYIKSSSVKDDF